MQFTSTFEIDKGLTSVLPIVSLARCLKCVEDQLRTLNESLSHTTQTMSGMGKLNARALPQLILVSNQDELVYAFVMRLDSVASNTGIINANAWESSLQTRTSGRRKTFICK